MSGWVRHVQSSHLHSPAPPLLGPSTSTMPIPKPDNGFLSCQMFKTPSITFSDPFFFWYFQKYVKNNKTSVYLLPTFHKIYHSVIFISDSYSKERIYNIFLHVLLKLRDTLQFHFPPSLPRNRYSTVFGIHHSTHFSVCHICTYL